MIIEIESVYGDTIIHGQYYNNHQLKSIVKDLLTYVDESEFVSAFCKRYGFELIDRKSINADYIIDLDTHKVIKPKH